MTRVRALLPVLVLFAMTFATRTVQAACWSYYAPAPDPCVGEHDCTGQWQPVYCDFGCTSGSCNDRGNSTECCGVREDYAQISPDGGNGCNTGDCGEQGEVRIRSHAQTPRATPEHRAELLQSYSPGLIMVSASMSYKPPELLYRFNGCSHSYELVVEDARMLASGGM